MMMDIGKTKGFDPKAFTTPVTKSLPIFLLLDVSGSMKGEKLDCLNRSINEMILRLKAFKSEIRFLMGVLLFGSKSSIFLLPTDIEEIRWRGVSVDQSASSGRAEKGITPMGVTFKDLKSIIEDKEITPSHAYRPLVLLVSDGKPNKGWEEPLRALVLSGRSSKCDRMAMAIGKDANHEVLKLFVENTGNPVFLPQDASGIQDFFKLATMSVTMRTQSRNPNSLPSITDFSPNSSRKLDVFSYEEDFF
jgi:uncharacterized protein YegL